MSVRINRGRLPQPIPGAMPAPGGFGDTLGTILGAANQVMPAIQESQQRRQRASLLDKIADAGKKGDTKWLKDAYKKVEGLEPEERTPSTLLGIIQESMPEDPSRPIIDHVSDRAAALQEGQGLMGTLRGAFDPTAQPRNLLPEEEEVLSRAPQVMQSRQERELAVLSDMLTRFPQDRLKIADEERTAGEPTRGGVSPRERDIGQLSSADRNRLRQTVAEVRSGIEQDQLSTKDEIIDYITMRANHPFSPETDPDIWPIIEPIIGRFAWQMERAQMASPEERPGLIRRAIDGIMGLLGREGTGIGVQTP